MRLNVNAMDLDSFKSVSETTIGFPDLVILQAQHEIKMPVSVALRCYLLANRTTVFVSVLFLHPVSETLPRVLSWQG